MSELGDLKRHIDDRFEAFQKFLNSMNVKLGKSETEIDNCKEDKEEIKDTLYGNGKDGLVIKVDRIHQSLKRAGVMKKGTWTNIGIIFVCVGVVASIIIGVVSITDSQDKQDLRAEISKMKMIIAERIENGG